MPWSAWATMRSSPKSPPLRTNRSSSATESGPPDTATRARPAGTRSVARLARKRSSRVILEVNAHQAQPRTDPCHGGGCTFRPRRLYWLSPLVSCCRSSTVVAGHHRLECASRQIAPATGAARDVYGMAWIVSGTAGFHRAGGPRSCLPHLVVPAHGHSCSGPPR
jgi:hypothetical protein